MNDLLAAVKGSAIYGRPDDSLGEDLEANIGLPLPPGKSDMESFYEKVNDIKKDFMQIKTLHGEVLASYERGKGLIKTKDMQAHREELQVGRCILVPGRGDFVCMRAQGVGSPGRGMGSGWQSKGLGVRGRGAGYECRGNARCEGRGFRDDWVGK